MPEQIPTGDEAPIFIVGAPRSGTTWLQLLLSQHPAIATSQETHFFSGYLAPWQRTWERELAAAGGRRVGLSAVLGEAQFRELMAAATHHLLAQIRRSKAGATRILEKTPVHVHHTELIRSVLPEARFIHLVRDPRSVVASILAASSSWGTRWAGGGPSEAAWRWHDAVRAGRRLADTCAQATQLRYEALKADPAGELERLLAWLALPADRGRCEAAVEACRLDRLREGGPTVASTAAAAATSGEPAGFYRRGDTGGWRQELSPARVALVEHITADLMRHYGYPPATGQWPTRVPLRELPGYLRARARRRSTS